MADESADARTPGWKRDPWKRFAGRYWDGEGWTEHVVSAGKVQATDPVPEYPPPDHVGAAPPSTGGTAMSDRSNVSGRQAEKDAEAGAGGQWWAGIAKATIAVNVRYLNLRTPTKSMGMGTFKVTEDGLQWRSNLGRKLAMPWAAIEAIDIEGETSKRVTATRVLTLGVFALAAKKEKRDTHMTVATDAAEHAFVFERTPPEVIKSKLRPVLVALSAIGATAVAPPSPGDGPRLSVADEIKKLAALRDAGILTEDEFQSQKMKLLG